MSNLENYSADDNTGFTDFDEMVMVGDLASVEQLDIIRQQRIRLKGQFALAMEFGTEEVEEPEEA